MIIFEFGCGKGEYIVGLVCYYFEKNFIGIDIKGNRMFVGVREVFDVGFLNVVFFCVLVDFIEDYFVENEIDEIWFMFLDF